MGTLSFSAIAAAIIPFIVNLVKKLSFIGNKYAPVAAFLCGLIAGLIGFFTGIMPEGTTLIQAVMIGIAIGGTSTGLYDTQKKLMD